MPKKAAHYLPVSSSKGRSHIICKIEGSPRSSSLTITATDGDNAFYAEFSKNDLGKGKSASFDGTDEEWMKILMDALFTQEDDTVQLSAKKPKDKITINVQRTEEEEEFPVNLGRLDIPRDTEEREIDIMDWLTESTTATIAAKTKARKLEKETSSEHDTIAQLQNQLDTLIKAKDDYETELLTKFNMLLNEKKAKIRDLTNNRPVPEARIPPSLSPAPEDQDSKPTKRGAKKATKPPPAKPPPKKPAATRGGKRKRTPTPEPEDVEMPDVSDEDEDDGDVTADDEESVQGESDREEDMARVFGRGRSKEREKVGEEGDVTEDEEL